MTDKIKHWACENCNWNEDGIKHCRIREYNYAIYDLKCPREIELEKKAKKWQKLSHINQLFLWGCRARYDLLALGQRRDEGDFTDFKTEFSSKKVIIPDELKIAVKSTNGYFSIAVPENEGGWPCGFIFLWDRILIRARWTKDSADSRTWKGKYPKSPQNQPWAVHDAKQSSEEQRQGLRTKNNSSITDEPSSDLKEKQPSNSKTLDSCK